MSQPPTNGSVRLWRRVSLRKQMAYGFAIPIVIVLLASLFLTRALDSLSRNAATSIESTEAIGLRHALLNSVLDAETGLRGYVLAGDPEFLRPYSSAWRKFDEISQRLEVRDATRLRQFRRLREIETLFNRWRSEFAEPQIALRRSAPVGESNQLSRLASYLDAPYADEPEQLRAYNTALARLGARSLARGPHADEINAVLELARAGGMATPAVRAELAGTLRKLAERARETEDRILANVESKRGLRLIDAIRALVQSSLDEESAEQRAAAIDAAADAERVRWITLIVPVTALLLGLVLTTLLLIDAARAIDTIGSAAALVAGGDLTTRLPVRRRDELGRLGDAFNGMADELAERHRRSGAIDRFQTLLVTSSSMEEIYAVVGRLCTEIFPAGGSGAIYRIGASRTAAERVAQWNWPDAANGRVLHPEDCRAVRSGQPYFAGEDTIETPCRHTQQLGVTVARSLCLPLSAYGETLGVLQLCRFEGNVHAAANTRDIETAVAISEQLSMALANLQLREQLRNQSIRDPLTGLFNRRYLEETMERELARTARDGKPLAVVAIDVDHFKRFNDTHGHEAGDTVLIQIAAALRRGIRTTDVACRYGGEEFVLLMPESPMSIAVERVESLRRQIGELRLHIGDVPMDPVTISGGIAIAPLHGESGEMLLRNADTALYAAKAAGRNRILVYGAQSLGAEPETRIPIT